MTPARKTVLAAALAAACLAFPAASFAQDDHMMEGEEMMADDQGGDAMKGDDMMAGDNMMGEEAQPMMHAEITCSAAGMTDAGMMIEFHNMGESEIPAGSTAHWKIRGVAQGDVHFMDAMAPGGMKTQNYMADAMVHMSNGAPCTVEMK